MRALCRLHVLYLVALNYLPHFLSYSTLYGVFIKDIAMDVVLVNLVR
ncbi:MAG: hypothetical protein WCA20_09365 [Candidatus Sulfotelmatobacter sp.]